MYYNVYICVYIHICIYVYIYIYSIIQIIYVDTHIYTCARRQALGILRVGDKRFRQQQPGFPGMCIYIYIYI